MSTELYATALRDAGLRATPARIALLQFLEKDTKPVTVETIKKHLPSMDTVTLYRNLEKLSDKGLVGPVELRHGHMHYELLFNREHHHHIVCTSCGRIEDIFDCVVEKLSTRPKSEHFKRLDSHALEYFGVCNTCSAQ